jgi:hypothetical protein
MTVVEADTVEIPIVSVPAFGYVASFPRRTLMKRTLCIIFPLICALLIRSLGLISPSPDDSPLPGLPDSVEVTHGLIRGGQPQELDLVGMHDNYGVRWLVDLEPADVQEEAVARQLGLNLLQLDVADGVPTASQMKKLVGYLATTAAATGRSRGSTEVVYMHDQSGCGPVLVVSAVLELLRREMLSDVVAKFSPAERSCLTAKEIAALQDVAAATQGADPRPGPYAELRGVTW